MNTSIVSASNPALYSHSTVTVQRASLETVGQQAQQGALSSRPIAEVNSPSSLTKENSTTKRPDSQVKPDADISATPLTQKDSAAQSNSEQNDIEKKAEQQKLVQEQKQIDQLSARDREVRAHEQAHAAVGGQYAGAPKYEFQRGPDGVNYAVGGEVSISTGPAATPEETIQKMQIVRRAALAPAEPSPQDRSVAAQATRLEVQARADLQLERAEERQQVQDDGESQATEESRPVNEQGAETAREEVAPGGGESYIASQLARAISSTSISNREGTFFRASV